MTPTSRFHLHAIRYQKLAGIVCLLTIAASGVVCRPNLDQATSAQTPSDATIASQWRNPNGSIRWPPDEGFAGKPQEVKIAIGVQLERYGYPSGSFVAPVGEPAPELSMAPGTIDKPYYVYEVLKPLPALEGKAAPWFDQPGGGVQYDLVKPIEHWLTTGFLKTVKQAMHLEELARKLEASNVPADMVSLVGGLPNEAHCIEQVADGTWRTYYSERGRRSGLKSFETEEAACEDLYRKVMK
ncbi:TNT domain-containing protein [Blastopirellula sp. J2-11]|uniref:TNT domain-containing protein n=1 Tax=Blastopirellula sp. J2-11 TaxID=2943192 RepID=UPI0021CA6A2C|nr:TNT domain-containing protein [Blastopirellula sp. J2-11]UUO06706.1 TNT domain-containing protein [Blastopirellula sp. J2-11]